MLTARRQLAVVCWVWAAAGAAEAQQVDEPQRSNEEDRDGDVYVGARAGLSLNDDQIVLGGHALFDDFVHGVGLETLVLLGFGGNHVTVRPSIRLAHTFWIGGREGLGITPAAGATLLLFAPVGPFARFCQRVDLSGCGGWDFGCELGAALRYGNTRVEAMAGVDGPPAVTIALAWETQPWS